MPAESYNGQHICEALLTSIEQVIVNNSPETKAEPVGLIQALYDPDNTAGTTIRQVDSEDGHIKEVRIKRYQRGTSEDVSDSKTCASVAEKARLEEKMTVTRYKETAVTLSWATVQRLCSSASALEKMKVESQSTNGTNEFNVVREIIKQLNLNLNAVRTAVNGDLNGLLAPQVGTWRGGATSKNFAVYNQGNGAAFADGFNQLGHEYRQASMNGKPIIVGYGNFDLANRALMYGCCNDGGTDFGQMKPGAMHKFYEDFQTESTFGSNGLVVMAPGTAQFVKFNEFQGSHANRIDNVQFGTMPDLMVPGLKWDIRLIEDGCNEKFTLIVGLHYDLYVAPLDSFAAADPLTGVNGVFNAVATQQYSKYQIAP